MSRHFLFLLTAFLFFAFLGSMSGVHPAEAVSHCPQNYRDTTRSGVCLPTTTGLSAFGVDYLLINFMKWILGIFGTLTIIAFVISGIQYLTSAGDDEQITVAKRNMKYSIIGVVIALSGFVILTAIAAAFSGLRANF